ncbi:MAG: TrkA C-terminal domain-containing protein [Thermoproteus sp. AZ2]|uniref:TrkA C-terminal domain-containing protein n=1 Tax=Thermoproteus sp. AZ2 TaxID=1609232 RepID=A0ACC6UZG2_9CREN|nr:MAG: portal protein [Thermoproteus sp. AZ2]
MARKALVLDSGDDLAKYVVEALADNGYIIHLISNESRGKEFLRFPVYIHTVKGEKYEDLLEEIGLGEVEVALLISMNDGLNISLAKACRERGVPIVIASIRNSSYAEDAEKYGIAAVSTSQCLLGRIYRILNLRFSRITPLKGDVGLLEILVTADSRVIGEELGELERKYGVKASIIRENELLIDPETVVQEGDYLIIIGRHEVLKELST